MDKITIDKIADALADAADRLSALEIENQNLNDENQNLMERLLLAQSEALAAMKRTASAPKPRDIGHENVQSWVVRKSGELQVSPGVLWGMVFDLISRNGGFFDGGDTEPKNTCDSIFDKAAELDPFTCELKVGDIVEEIDLSDKWEIENILTDEEYDRRVYRCKIPNGCGQLYLFFRHELKFIRRP